MDKLKDLFYESIKTADVAGEEGNLYMGRRIKQVIFKEDMENLYNEILKWHSDQMKEYQEQLFKSGMVVMKDGKVVNLEDFFIEPPEPTLKDCLPDKVVIEPSEE